MHTVSAILRRTLLQHIPVAVEELGTLRTTFRGVRLLPGQRLDPPRRLPTLVPTGPDDIPLVEIVATELAIDPTSAYELCREWHEEGYRTAQAMRLPPGSLVFEGIGTVRNDAARGNAFRADPELLEMFNPFPPEPLAVPTAVRYPTATGRTPGSAARPPRTRKPGKKHPHHYTVSFLAILIVLAAVGYLGYYLWRHTDWLSDLLNF